MVSAPSEVVRVALDRSVLPMAIVDRRDGLVFANRKFRELADCPPQAGASAAAVAIVPGEGILVDGRSVLDLVQGHAVWEGAGTVDHPLDGRRACLVSVVSLNDPGDTRQVLVEIHPLDAVVPSGGGGPGAQDLDDLTGLSTLRVFRVGLREALARAEQSGRAVAVLFADLDGFKLVNDTLGHTVGNRVLAAVGTRIRQQIRRSDMAARVGGDEFVVLLPEITCPDDAGRVAGALLGALDAPIEVDGHKIKIGASIGIAVAPDDSTDVDKLLEMADVAMYRVKKLGKRRFEFFASFCAGERSRRSSIEGQLRSALDGDQFVMHYQPIVDPGTGHACFFEALIRWQHPDRGLLLPHEFVPFLDETRLICQVGEWAVGRVAADAATLVRSGRPNAVVTINIDPKQWVMGDLAATIDRAVESNAIQHRNIALEIVESTMIQDFVWTREWLTAIREKGTTVFLDDFGSGYAALNYFMELPFDFVKIDRSILKRCPGDRVSLTLIQSIKFLARQLGIMVVAEGVETAFQHELIRTGGIPLAQGFHYCRPLPLDVLMSLFEPEAENSPDAYAPPFLPQRSANRQAVAAARA